MRTREMRALALLLGVAMAFVDKCTRGASQTFRPSLAATAPDGWQRSRPPSPLYQSALLTLNNNTGSLSIRVTNFTQPLYYALEYALPNHTGSLGANRVWLYEIAYAYLQFGQPASVTAGGLGPWHAIGLDWGERNSTPSGVVVRYSSGTNRTGATDVATPLSTAFRVADGFCTDYAYDSANRPGCVFVGWPNRTQPESYLASYHTVVYQFALVDTLLMSVSIDSSGSVFALPALQRANASAPGAWAPLRRAVLINYATALDLEQMRITQTDLTCPGLSTSAATPAATTVPPPSGTTAPSGSTPAGTAPSRTTPPSVASLPAPTTPPSNTVVVPSATSLPASRASATTATSAARSASESLPAAANATTLQPVASATERPATGTNASAVGIAPSAAAAAPVPGSPIVVIAVAAVAVAGCLLLTAAIGATVSLRRALCWVPIFHAMPPCLQTACCACAARPIDADDPLAETLAAADVPTYAAVRLPTEVYDPIGGVAKRPPVTYESFRPVAVYDSPDSVLAV